MTEQEFRLAFMDYLSPLEAKMTEALRAFAEIPVHSDVHFVDFTLIEQDDFPDYLLLYV